VATRSVALLLLAVGVLPLPVGCGHDVAPTGEFRDPASLPQAQDLLALSTPVGVNLGWTVDPSVFAIIDGWYIYRAEGETAPPDEAYRRINPDLFTESSYYDLNVEDGTQYWYRLTSVSPAGVEGVPTFPIAVRVDFTPPSPPTGLGIEWTGRFVHLVWDAHPEDLEHFNVFRTPPEPPLLFGPVPATQLEWFDGGVAAGATYRYWVTAVDRSLNESAPSETVSVVIPLPAAGAP